ncbi:MAG TPA: hypothetical protein VFK02_17700 [Kofleriaceae bacterium]|nr:hypothetical protein [Kofleriaceae bacterium]
MKALCTAVVAAAMLGAPAVAHAEDGATTRHLLLGVRAFKDGRYDEALVELRLVARAPDAPADLAFYLGPTLYKLARYEEALAVFAGSSAPPDALTDFYRGQTCYKLRLFRKARAVFVGLRARGLGPALDEAAARYVAEVDAAYRTPPAPVAIDYYIAQGLELAGSAPVVAAEFLDEARQVEALAAAPHRHGEIIAALAAAWNAAGRAQAAIDVVLAERSPAPDASWQLARAYLALGDPAHARPLLDAIARGRGPHAAEAAALIAKLPP